MSFKDFLDFLSKPAFTRYSKIDDYTEVRIDGHRRKVLQLVRDGKKLVIDVDDVKELTSEEVKKLEDKR